MRYVAQFVPILMFLIAAVGSADVKTREATTMEFPGLPKMMRMMINRSAGGGVQETILSGDRLYSITDGKTGQLIDRKEKAIYEVEINKKRYRKTTYAEYRERLEKAQDALANLKMGGGSGSPNAQPEKKMTVDVDVVAGADDNRNGVACKHQTITISFHEEGKSLDEAGGMKLVSDQCIGPAVPEQFEIAEFMREFLDEIGLMSLDSATGALSGMYGGMKPLIEKLAENAKTLGGTSYATTTEMFTYPDPNAPQAQGASAPSLKEALGGLGGFGGFGRKRKDEQQQQPGATAVRSGPNLLTRMQSDLQLITTDVSPDEVEIPANFKQRK